MTNDGAINAKILLRTAKEIAESNDSGGQVVHQKFDQLSQ